MTRGSEFSYLVVTMATGMIDCPEQIIPVVGIADDIGMANFFRVKERP